MKRSFKAMLVMGGVALSASMLTLLAVQARADGVPEDNALTYTGYLEDGEGQPLTGDPPIEVHFWGSEDAKDVLCSGDNATNTSLSSGRFQIALPKKCADAVKASPDIWVEVEVDGSRLGRTRLGAVPYAIEAGHATKADVASQAEGALKVTLESLGEDVAKLAELHISYKGGNNGSVTCNAFCPSPDFLPVGTCVAAKQENNGAYLSCDQKPTSGNLLCWCASP